MSDDPVMLGDSRGEGAWAEADEAAPADLVLLRALEEVRRNG